MTNNTPIYWDISGTSLHTYAWSIETKAGNHKTPASKRGDDESIPFIPGHNWLPKVRDAKFVTLPMWVAGRNQDGSIDGSMTEEQKFENNWRTLLQLFTTSEQFPLTKRWYEGTDIMAATAMAEVLDFPDLSKTAARTAFRFNLELKLADPFYYGAEIEEAVGTIVVEGYEPTSHVIVEMAAGTVTFPDGNFLTYSGGGTVEIDCHRREAKVGSTFVNGLVDRNRRFPTWPMLYPGSNAITGSGTIRYEPAYW